MKSGGQSLPAATLGQSRALVVGDLVLRLLPSSGGDGHLVPRFFVGETEESSCKADVDGIVVNVAELRLYDFPAESVTVTGLPYL